jgi:hypothetical protein
MRQLTQPEYAPVWESGAADRAPYGCGNTHLARGPLGRYSALSTAG